MTAQASFSTDPFADIRPFLDSEVDGVIASLTSNDQFVALARNFLGNGPEADLFLQQMSRCHTIDEFKRNVSYHLSWRIAKATAFSLSLSGRSRLGGDRSFTFISNHRDIVLDSAFLSILLSDVDYTLPRIAIGDNLISQKWIELLVRLNDSFLVKRNLPIRQLAEAATQLSDYIHHTVANDQRSVWIAQREGRAKNSHDVTQPAILKMLTRGGDRQASVAEKIRILNIVPTSICYEYDPCDWLKAYELHQRSLHPEGAYTKAKHEDEFNMLRGIMGQKGRVHITLGTPLNQLLPDDIDTIPTAEFYPKVAQLIDREIYKYYRLYPGNYIAWDLLQGETSHNDLYSSKELDAFQNYLDVRVARAIAFDPEAPRVPGEDELLSGSKLKEHPYYVSLREILLNMYARPAINHHSVVD